MKRQTQASGQLPDEFLIPVGTVAQLMVEMGDTKMQAAGRRPVSSRCSSATESGPPETPIENGVAFRDEAELRQASSTSDPAG
jgi:hypothetical protein